MSNKKELIDLKKRYYGNNSNSNSINYPAFSLVEISVSLVVIAVILAALSPVITKRLTSTSTQKNKISTNCSSYFPQAMGYCAMCYVNPVVYVNHVEQNTVILVVQGVILKGVYSVIRGII